MGASASSVTGKPWRNWVGRTGKRNFRAECAGLSGLPTRAYRRAALVGAGTQRRTMSLVPLEPTEIHRLRDRFLWLTFDKVGRLVAWENGTKTGD